MRLAAAVVGSLVALYLSFFLCACPKSTQKYPENSKKAPSVHFVNLPKGVVATWSRNAFKGPSRSSAGDMVSAIPQNGHGVQADVRANVHSHAILNKEEYGQKRPDIHASRSPEVLLEQPFGRRAHQGSLASLNRTHPGSVTTQSGFDFQSLEMDPVDPDTSQIFDQGSTCWPGSPFHSSDLVCNRGCLEDPTKDSGGLRWEEFDR